MSSDLNLNHASQADRNPRSESSVLARKSYKIPKVACKLDENPTIKGSTNSGRITQFSTIKIQEQQMHLSKSITLKFCRSTKVSNRSFKLFLSNRTEPRLNKD